MKKIALLLPAIQILAILPILHAQTPAFPLTGKGLVISRPVQPPQPFTVSGPSGILVGTQDGQFESWINPIKFLSHLTIEANLQDYTVPIPVNPQSANIEVRPDHTTITYSHPGFTIRQIMFSLDQETRVPPVPNLGPGNLPMTGPVVLFQIDSIRPLDLTFRFTPEMRWMWPRRSDGVPGPDWIPDHPNVDPNVAEPPRPDGTGFYVLGGDYPGLLGAVTIPTATPGILAPYQERPQVHPLELHLHYDPKRDGTGQDAKFFPLLMAVGATPQSATTPALHKALLDLESSLPEAYKAHAAQYAKLESESTSIQTPDKALNEAFQWGVVSIEQLRARVPAFPATASQTSPSPGPQSLSPAATTSVPEVPGSLGPSATTSVPEVPGSLGPSNETALVAGYFSSGDSARPGFGWFFGRDALYSLYAVNSYGDFALTRAELQFLIERQRADGKIMHEYAQTAADPSVNWKSFDYMYAAADATPLFLMAMRDYYRASGDKAFLEAHKEAIEKAWAFETAASSDTDHDGIYDNSQGTGWVESWPAAMPHQELYMALLDRQASQAYADLAAALNNTGASSAASARATKIATTIEQEYYDPAKGCYAFATNPPVNGKPEPNGPRDNSTTIYPAVAWWDYPRVTMPEVRTGSDWHIRRALEAQKEAAKDTKSANAPASQTNAGAPSFPATGAPNDRSSSLGWFGKGGTNKSPNEGLVTGHDFSRADKTNQKGEGASAPEASSAATPLAHPETCLSNFAGPELDTDWGTRDLARTSPFYDGLSYHQGSVWPLFTGWGALAEYRANQPLAGQQLLMQNVDLTWAQDPGAVTELLSGDFFIPFGRSTSHQLWSSAMVITPTLRGLFGINLDASPDAATNTITVNPHLPANWMRIANRPQDNPQISNLHIGDQKVTLLFYREGQNLQVELRDVDKSKHPIQLRSDLPGTQASSKPRFAAAQISIPLPPVELVPPDQELPTPGSRTNQIKVLSTTYSAKALTVKLAVPADTDEILRFERNQPVSPRLSVQSAGNSAIQHAEFGSLDKIAGLEPAYVRITVPKGQGYQTLEFTLTW